MLNSLNNIQSTFNLMKVILIITIVTCMGVCGYAVYASLQFAEAQRQKIYVLDEGKALVLAIAQDVYQNRMAEAKSHVKRFHQFFFSLSPNKEAIDYAMGEAMKLADNGALQQYNTMVEQGFFQKLIAGGVSTEILIDSVVVDDTHYPYYAKVYGKTSIVRTSSVTYRNLETECYLRNCTRSDDNPHGFMIEQWHIIDNSDIKVINR